MDWLDMPPRPEGTVAEQVEQLWTYLFQLAERLNTQHTTGDRPGRTGT